VRPLLPESADRVGSLAELVDYAERRVEQSRRIDPTGPFPPPILEVRTQLEIWATLASFVLVPATLVTACFTRGPVLWTIGALAGAIFAYAFAAVRRGNRWTAKWRSEGVVVAGALVMANDKAFLPGMRTSYPGVVVFSFDPLLGRDSVGLSRLAERTFELKEADPTSLPENLREIGSQLASERPTWRRRRLPADFCGNETTWLADVMFEPERLPRGHVDRTLWPCLVHPTIDTAGPSILPLEIWWREDLDPISKRLGERSSEEAP
jgi:hypothetical protein